MTYQKICRLEDNVTKKSLVVSVIAVATTFLGLSSTSVSAQRPSAPLTAEQLVSLEAAPNFAGAIVTHESYVLNFRGSGIRPSFAQHAVAPDGKRLVFRYGRPTSMRVLLQREQWLVSQLPRWRGWRSSFEGVSTDVANDIVKVDVEPGGQLPAPLKKQVEAGRIEIDRVSEGKMSYFGPAKTLKVSVEDTRDQPVAPWRGGIPVFNSTDVPWQCTGGPILVDLNTPQQYFMLLAGHCFNQAQNVYAIGRESVKVGGITSQKVNNHNGPDVEILGLGYPANQRDGVWTHTNSARAQNGQGNPAVGDSICTDGFQEGEICGVTVTSINNCEPLGSGGGTNCGLFGFSKPGTALLTAGDSGSPIYQPLNGGAFITGIAEGSNTKGVFGTEIGYAMSQFTARSLVVYTK